MADRAPRVANDTGFKRTPCESSETLLDRLWGGKEGRDPEPVRNFVRKLRRKLGDPAIEPTYVVNERGLGYRMPEPGGS